MQRSLTLCLAGCFFSSLLIASASAQTEPATTRATETVTSENEAVEANGSPFEGLVFYCTRCKKEVPEQRGAGSTCPHCGAFFNTSTNADGSESEAAPPSNGFPIRYWGLVLLALIFGGEYAWRRLRRSRV